jgi:hypothetical protein
MTGNRLKRGGAPAFEGSLRVSPQLVNSSSKPRKMLAVFLPLRVK